MELSSADVHVEDSASPELWKHCGHQTGRADPPHGPPRWIAHQRGLHLEQGLIQAVEDFDLNLQAWLPFKPTNVDLYSWRDPASYVIRLIHYAAVVTVPSKGSPPLRFSLFQRLLS